jgi:epoxyqueuosine reductase
MSLSADIKEYALSIGYDRVGFTTADSFPLYDKELNERRDMYAWAASSTLQIFKSSDPRNILLEARSIVVTAYDYFRHSYPEEMEGKVGRVYQSVGGIPPTAMHRARYRLLREYLEKLGCRVGKSNVDLPARLAGARAGITTYGKNCFAYADGIGSFIVISGMVIDRELEYDEPTMRVKCPEKCTLCIDSCPTGALYEPLRMDPRRCIAYNSYATPNSHFGAGQEIIPSDIREHMGSWVFGCDVCQQVCPRNRTRLKMKLPPNAYLEYLARDFTLDKLLTMSDEQFSRISTILNYIKDKRYYRRNAAAAMGNQGDTSYIPHLVLAMQDPYEVVRGHAAWALGKIGGSDAIRILETAHTRENSKYVLQEICQALSRER